MIELVVFDLAGTTVCDDDAVSQAFGAALAEHNIAPEAARVSAVMGLPKPEAIARLIGEAGGTAAPDFVEAIHHDFVRRMCHYYATDPAVAEIPGSSAVFATLRRAGIKVALNTGFSRTIVDVLLHRLGWETPATVDATITSDEVQRGRPFPDMVFALMHRLGVTETQRVAKVGDTWADLEEGANAGCGMIVGVATGSYSHEMLAQRPHTHLIASVAELPALLGVQGNHGHPAS